MQPITLKELLEAGCHFGHKVDRWHPKAAQFIYQEREGIHVIDLAKTKSGLEKAAQLVEQLALEGKSVLFLGTKRQATGIIREEAARVGAPFIAQRWIGGFLTNWSEIHKNLEKIRRLTEEEANNTWKKYPKHERVKLSRYLKKLNFLYSGVVQLMQPPAALFVVDIRKERVAVLEAKRMGIPVIGIVDTNSDPEMVDYVIPSNDDAVGAISCIVTYISEAYKLGSEARQKQVADAKEKEAKSLQAEAAKTAEKTPEVKPAEKVASPATNKKALEKPVVAAEKKVTPEAKAQPKKKTKSTKKVA